MIKFFRKIRQRLLVEKRFSKYLLYAFGEIVLVVIGILIALQINNWNEKRKKADIEVQLYYNILNDLKSEYSSIESHINSIKKYDTLHKHIYAEINNKTPSDSGKFYNFLLWYQRYKAFFNEKYKESLSSITNKRIHQSLKWYLKVEDDSFKAVVEFNEHQLQEVRPYLSKYGINDSETMFNEADDFFTLINRKQLINYSKLKKQYGSEELDQLLFSIRFKNLWMVQNFDWLLAENRRFQLVLTHEMASAKIAENFEHIEPKTIGELQIIGKTDDEIIAIIDRELNHEAIYSFEEHEINRFGYELLGAGKYQEAVKVFMLNIELNPSWNTYDSYGEGLLKIGAIEEATKAYEKSLELNPDNSTAKEIIERHKNKG